MNNKSLYWIALGVFALGLNSEYQKGNLSLARGVADRAQAVVCQISAHAEQALIMARALTSTPAPEFRIDDQFVARQQAKVERVLAEHQADLDRAMALRQADIDRAQAKIDRMHAAIERAQAVRVRMADRPRFKLTSATDRRMIVVCPKTGERISVQPGAAMADIEVDVPDVEVGDSF